MIQMIQQKMRDAFLQHDGVLSVKQAESLGLSKEGLRKAYLRGDLDRLHPGIYALNDAIPDDQVVTQQIYRKGIYSHESAAALYGLTSLTPFFYYMTFPHGYHSDELDRNQVSPIYATDKYYNTGKTTQLNWLSNEIVVYDKEKTVIDLMRSKHTLPLIKNEVIESYLHDPEADFERLRRYAKELNMIDRIEKEVFNYGRRTTNEESGNSEITRVRD